MKIKWKLRFQNKFVLAALVSAVVTFIYQILGVLGITPAISEKQIVEWAGMVLNLLVVLGIITDPTTAGLDDSEQVMLYDKPRE